jgi:pSer/pThr/pTyr-binding forkhead associated (FHA) protein
MGDLDRTIRRDNDAGEVRVYVRYLTSSRDYLLGQEQELKNNRIEIGRDSSCDIRYDNKQNTVSRRHAVIIKDGRDWVVRNNSESNPTLINGRPVNNSWYLSSGDVIQLSYEGPKLEFIVKTIKKAPPAHSLQKEQPKVIIKEVNSKEKEDELETVYQILSFCFPFIGAIIWLVNIKSSPNKAKSACTAALIGIGVSFLVNVIAGAS